MNTQHLAALMTAHDTAAPVSPDAKGARTGTLHYPVSGSQVSATALPTENADGWHVCLEFGHPGTGGFLRYLSTSQARALAASLVSAADHYDAETARLAGE